MAPVGTRNLPDLLALSYFARALDPEVGPDRAQEAPNPDDLAPSVDNPISKPLVPRIKHLTPWPYIAIAVISSILIFVLGYAIWNCYRRTKTPSTGVKQERISLLDRRLAKVPQQKERASQHRALLISKPERNYSLDDSMFLDTSTSTFPNDSGSPKELPSTRALDYTIALPSSCYIPYTPTTSSLARKGDSRDPSPDRTDHCGKFPPRSKAKSMVDLLKRRAGGTRH